MLGAVLFVTFFILGWFGRELYRKVPPIPLEVRIETGRLLMTKKNILEGQQAWQSVGGQQVGSIWGHGAYQAPDWSADWLHREALALQGGLSLKRFGKAYRTLDDDQKAGIDRVDFQKNLNQIPPNFSH
jgi:nitric oxide reductase subunit B